MTYRCCLCNAVDKIREGWIPDSGGVPLCAEHRAQTYWRSRQPAAPRSELSMIEQTYQNAMTLAAIASTAS